MLFSTVPNWSDEIDASARELMLSEINLKTISISQNNNNIHVFSLNAFDDKSINDPDSSSSVHIC